MDLIGEIPLPGPLGAFGSLQGGGLGKLLDLLLNIMLVGAGIYALFNLVLAGYAFMSAGGDPGKVASAWAKIYQTVIGVLVAAGALVLAAIFGQLIFGQWDFLLKPELPTP